MNFKKIFATAVLAGACYGAVWAGRYWIPQYKIKSVDAKYVSRSRGNPSAPVRIVEYLDFECENCRLSVKFMEGYLAAHPKDIYLQIRYYPLIHNHLYALKSAIYAECASRQKKFWEFSKDVFEAQAEWAQSKDPDAIFTALAKKNQMDAARLGACVENEAVKQEVLSEREEGKSLGITMTPTFFVNGMKIDGLAAMAVEMEKYFPEKKPEKAS